MAGNYVGTGIMAITRRNEWWPTQSNPQVRELMIT